MITPDYEIKGYAGARHAAVRDGRARAGDLLLHTWHIGESSRDMEIAAWRSRMARGEVSHIEVIDKRAKTTETIYARPA